MLCNDGHRIALSSFLWLHRMSNLKGEGLSFFCTAKVAKSMRTPSGTERPQIFRPEDLLKSLSVTDNGYFLLSADVSSSVDGRRAGTGFLTACIDQE